MFGIQQIVNEYQISFEKGSDVKEICFSQDEKLVQKGGLNFLKSKYSLKQAR